MAASFIGLRNALDSVEQPLAPAIEIICSARRNKRTIFFIGNGGSAAIAAHMAADFSKAGKIRTRAFNEAPSLTAIANDISFSEVFSAPLCQYAEPGDVLVAISSSGRSPNIVLAARAARQYGMSIITLSGFDEDNTLRALGDVNFHVRDRHYGVVEVAHHAICHAILDALC